MLQWRLQPCHSFWHCCAAKQHKSRFGGAQEHKEEERGEALEDRSRRLRQVIEDQACARKPQRSHPCSSGELALRRLSRHSQHARVMRMKQIKFACGHAGGDCQLIEQCSCWRQVDKQSLHADCWQAKLQTITPPGRARLGSGAHLPQDPPSRTAAGARTRRWGYVAAPAANAGAALGTACTSCAHGKYQRH